MWGSSTGSHSSTTIFPEKTMNAGTACRFSFVGLLSVSLLGCNTGQAAPPAQPPARTPVLAKEVFFTPLAERENVDSPAVWHGPDGQHWLFATGKSSHSVLVYDAVNGAPIRRVGGLGDLPGQFSRPNGVWVIDDYLLVVERDNRRVQVLALPDLVSLATFGAGELEKPYGLWVHRTGAGEYRVYVTDSYDAGEDNLDLAAMHRRVRVYRMEAEGRSVEGELVHTFGDVSGPGVLHVVESIHGDPAHDRLLVADEDMERGQNIKVYDLSGRFTGQVIGGGIFRYQPEGIALYDADGGEGYWIFADQGKRENLFHIFDRRTLAHLGTFSGETTLNTDGIWLTQLPLPRYPRGLLYAVHADAAVAAFSWTEVLEALDLR
jgi:3-phytase